jgi:hypothetical protein
VVAHEIPYVPGKRGWIYKWKWKVVPRVVFHTQKERERFEQYCQMRLKDSRFEIRRHHEFFQKIAERTQAAARQQLKLPADQLIFLCIGFIQGHKGFHRAINAFTQANLHGACSYELTSAITRGRHPPSGGFSILGVLLGAALACAADRYPQHQSMMKLVAGWLFIAGSKDRQASVADNLSDN